MEARGFENPDFYSNDFVCVLMFKLVASKSAGMTAKTTSFSDEKLALNVCQKMPAAGLPTRLVCKLAPKKFTFGLQSPNLGPMLRF
jgi:hypothetical protein